VNGFRNEGGFLLQNKTGFKQLGAEKCQKDRLPEKKLKLELIYSLKCMATFTPSNRFAVIFSCSYLPCNLKSYRISFLPPG